MYLSYLLLASDFDRLDMIAGHLWKILYPVIRKARAGPSAKVFLCESVLFSRRVKRSQPTSLPPL